VPCAQRATAAAAVRRAGLGRRHLVDVALARRVLHVVVLLLLRATGASSHRIASQAAISIYVYIHVYIYIYIDIYEPRTASDRPPRCALPCACCIPRRPPPGPPPPARRSMSRPRPPTATATASTAEGPAGPPGGRPGAAGARLRPRGVELVDLDCDARQRRHVERLVHLPSRSGPRDRYLGVRVEHPGVP
jgi:hypothetical protein